MKMPAKITELVQRVKHAHRIIRRISLTITITMATITIVSGAFSLLMARVPEYRLEMQAWISQHAKLDVQFAALSARWHGFGPQLEFTDAVIRSRDGKRILVIAKSGSLGFDLWTAIRTARLTALQFALHGTELKAIRKPNGVFEIIGQSDLPEYEHHEAFDLDSLPVGRVSISDVRLVFRDLKTKRGPWIIDNVDLSILRDNDSFDLEGQATLPSMMGKQLKFHASGKGSLKQVDALQWHAQVTAHDLNLKGWTQVMNDDWIAPREGMGSFDVSADFLGAHLQGFSGQVDFRDVVMKLPTWKTPLPVADTLHVKDDNNDDTAPAEPVNATSSASASAVAPVHYTKVKLAFNTLLTTEGWQTQFTNMQLEQEHAPWEPSNASLLIKLATVKESSAASVNDDEPLSDDEDNAAEHHVIERINASAQLVVLDNLWPLLAYLPESEKLARVRALNATGRIENVAVRYERDLLENTVNVNSAASSSGATDSSTDGSSNHSSSTGEGDITAGDAVDMVAMSPPRYSFRADFKQVGVSPVGKTPGVSGLSGNIEGTGARGTVQLDSRDVELALPHLFRTPLPVDHLTATLNWTRTTGNTRLQSSNVIVKSPNGDATAALTLDIPHEGSPLIDMHAHGANLEAASAPRYMPAGVMHAKVLEWLDNAFVAGHVNQADLTFTGPVKKFPFHNNEGLFLITANINDLTLQYQPGWMPATALQVNAEFRNMGFSATAVSGTLNGMSLENITGGIADYRNAVLTIKGQVHGGLDQALHYVQQSPVGPKIGSLFEEVNAKGSVQSQVSLQLPLKDMASRQVDIDVRMQDARLGLAGTARQASKVQGRFHIANESVNGVEVEGQFLQGPFSATTVMDHGNPDVLVTGHAMAAPLAEFLKLPAFVKMDGELNYRLTAPAYAQHDDNGYRNLFSVDSDLAGLKLDMPQPVTKSAAVTRPIHVDAELLDADTMQLRGSMDGLRALVRLQHGDKGWKFDRAGLRVDGVAAAMPADAGLRIEGNLPELTLDDWLQLGNAHAVTATATGSSSSSSSSVVDNAVHVQDILRSANLNVGKLHLYGFEWPNVRAVLQATDDAWRIDVAGDKASGQISVPYEFDAQPLSIDMDRLELHSTAGDAGDEAAAQKRSMHFDPRELPALQINVRDFRFGDHDFGGLQVHALRADQGLQVDNIEIDGDSFKGNGSGAWLEGPNGPLSSLMLTIESSDVRQTMQQLHFGDFVGAKHGRLQANLNWPGGIDENLLGRASGSMELQLDQGQLLTVQPGAGRMLGLLSIAELPRRLRLDFRDVTDKGLAFDSIHGTFEIKNGDAFTPDLLLSGPVAEIGVAGRIGLGAHDYDQTAVVTGDVGSALPVAGVALANPVVGGALLLFSQIFKEPLKGIARAYYHIGGTWDDPKLERIDQVAGRASMLNSAKSASSSSSASSSASSSSSSASSAAHAVPRSSKAHSRAATH